MFQTLPDIEGPRGGVEYPLQYTTLSTTNDSAVGDCKVMTFQ